MSSARLRSELVEQVGMSLVDDVAADGSTAGTAPPSSR
jgi:hypothetical protein